MSMQQQVGSPAAPNASSDHALVGARGQNHPVEHDQSSQHSRFSRRRARGACETCRSRRVRCDAMSLGVPCTNCLAFSIECIASTKKRRKVDRAEPDEVALFQSHDGCTPVNESTTASPHPMEMLQQQLMQDSIDMDLYAKYLKPGIRQAPIKEPGRVAYLGESSNFPLLLDNSSEITEVVHYQLPESYRDSRVKLAKLDKVEMESLRRKGALSLPPGRLCDDLVESFFIWVAPIVPVINRGRFMKQYQDPRNPPSLLLLQAIFLAGSRVCTNAHLVDSDREHSALTFYKRAKALYDAGYEDDRIVIIQALILMGWYWEKSGDGIGNVFYWNGLATTIAQGSGIHRSTEKSFMSKTDKRLWKRIWWTLFTRDRSVAVALGQPVQINTDDSDVEMVCEDDFLDEEYPPNPIAVQFFLQYVKLWRIMSFVPAQPDSLTVKAIRHNPSAFTQCDAALAQWLQECPEEMKWKESRYNFWSALLNCSYQTTISLLHQPDAPSSPSSYDSWSTQHLRHPTSSSQNVAFQAACKITSIVESMIVHNELRFSPAFMIHSLLSASIIQIYQMQSDLSSIDATTQQRTRVCIDALKRVSKVWLVEKMVRNSFEALLGDEASDKYL